MAKTVIKKIDASPELQQLLRAWKSIFSVQDAQRIAKKLGLPPPKEREFKRKDGYFYNGDAYVTAFEGVDSIRLLHGFADLIGAGTDSGMLGHGSHQSYVSDSVKKMVEKINGKPLVFPKSKDE